MESEGYSGSRYFNRSLKCPQKNDAFTVNDIEKGNGDLIYPVGLITVDEVSFAGGKYESVNTKYYLNKGNYYWTESPIEFIGNGEVVNVFTNGSWNFNFFVNNTIGMVPVINLKPEIVQSITGTGTMTDPFVVTTQERRSR